MQKVGKRVTREVEQLLLDVFGGASKARDPEPLISEAARKKLIAFGWYGGKFSHLPWLLPLLPTAEITTYCEAFGGSAAVLLNRDPAPVETYNDIDGEVVNFFRVLREETDALVKAISLTPFSREEYALACAAPPEDDDVERARRFYIRARQTRTGLAQVASVGRWANCIGTSRAGMSGVVSRWIGGADKLEAIANRLAGVQIENRPALDVMRIYDTPRTLHYLDPPYLHETRKDAKAYGFEMDTEAHRRLAAAANAAEGLVALSGYDHEFVRDNFPAPRWKMLPAPAKTIHSSKAKRTEILWINYDPETGRRLT